MKFFKNALSLLLLLSSCHRAPLEVDLVYVGARSLASYWVCTPDPSLLDPRSGQKLFVMWNFSKAQWQALVSPSVHLYVQFVNREETLVSWQMNQPQGTVCFLQVGSIDTPLPLIHSYRAEVMTEGKVAHYVEHALWTKWIVLQTSEKKCEEEKNLYSWDDIEEI